MIFVDTHFCKSKNDNDIIFLNDKTVCIFKLLHSIFSYKCTITFNHYSMEGFSCFYLFNEL